MKKLLLLSIVTLLSNYLFSQIPSYVPTSGLIGWYPFSGNPDDSSGNNLNGNIVGGVTLTTDRFGNLNSSYTFDGSTGYINVLSNSLLKLGNQYSISGWFNPNVITGQQRTIISQPKNSSQTGLCLNLDHLQHYNILCDNTDINGIHQISSDSIPSLNTWYHGVETYDGSMLRIYVNGILKNTLPYTIDLSTNQHTLTFGSQHLTSNNDFFSGKLDDIGVWNRPLTQQEILQLYSCVGSGPCMFYDTVHVSVTDTLIINSPLTGSNNTMIDTLKVYPNPTHDHVEINTGNYSLMSGYTIQILNPLTQIVFQNQVNQQLFDVSMSGWSKGTYILEIFDPQNKLVEKKEIVLQ